MFLAGENEKLLHKLVDEANVLVLYIHTSGTIILCNKKTQDLTGKPKDWIAGRYWLDVLSNQDNSSMQQQMLKAGSFPEFCAINSSNLLQC